MYTKRYPVIHLRATNDNNGNPRRLYMVVTDPPRYFDEGYTGHDVYRRVFPNAYEVATIDIPPAEYRALKKIADGQRRTR